jgi:hypothetical protein
LVPQAVWRPKKPGPYQLAIAGRKIVTCAVSGSPAAVALPSRATIARRTTRPIVSVRHSAVKRPSSSTVVVATRTQVPVRSWRSIVTARPASPASVRPLMRIVRSSSAAGRTVRPGRSTVASVPPDGPGGGSCAAAGAAATANESAAASIVMRGAVNLMGMGPPTG